MSDLKYFEEDGYIEYQSKCSLPYGKYLSSYNGCGWIAVYNYLYYYISRNINNDISKQDLEIYSRYTLQKSLFFGGLFGTSVFKIKELLSDLICKHKIVLTIKGNICYNNKCGIVLYFTGIALHYSFFEKISNDMYIFHNVDGKKAVSFGKFENEYIKFPLYLIIKPTKEVF